LADEGNGALTEVVDVVRADLPGPQIATVM
jgi:hypothetical protein